MKVNISDLKNNDSRELTITAKVIYISDLKNPKSDAPYITINDDTGSINAFFEGDDIEKCLDAFEINQRYEITGFEVEMNEEKGKYIKILNKTNVLRSIDLKEVQLDEFEGKEPKHEKPTKQPIVVVYPPMFLVSPPVQGPPPGPPLTPLPHDMVHPHPMNHPPCDLHDRFPPPPMFHPFHAPPPFPVMCPHHQMNQMFPPHPHFIPQTPFDHPVPPVNPLYAPPHADLLQPLFHKRKSGRSPSKLDTNRSKSHKESSDSKCNVCQSDGDKTKEESKTIDTSASCDENTKNVEKSSREQGSTSKSRLSGVLDQYMAGYPSPFFPANVFGPPINDPMQPIGSSFPMPGMMMFDAHMGPPLY